MTNNDRWRWLHDVQDQVRAGTLSANAEHVALALAVYYINGKHPAEAWPSQTELAAATGRPRRTVQRALAELHTAGHIEIKRGQKGVHGNVYRVR